METQQPGPVDTGLNVARLVRGLVNNQPWELVCHGKPAHPDELVAASLLIYDGETCLPGISDPDRRIFRYLEPEEDEATLLTNKRVIALGWGGDIDPHRDLTFDEHHLAEAKRGKECSATLAKRYLQLSPDLELLWRPLLEAVLRDDKSIPDPLHASGAVLNWQRSIDADLEQILVRFHEAFLNPALLAQEAFLAGIPREREEIEVLVPGGHRKICVFKNVDPGFLEDTNLTRVGRWFGAHLIVLHLKDTGHIQVINGVWRQGNMENVARVVRSREQFVQGRSPITDWDRLGQKGTLPECPEWCLTDSGNLLNGGQARPGSPVTKITPKDMVRILETPLNGAKLLAWQKQYFGRSPRVRVVS